MVVASVTASMWKAATDVTAQPEYGTLSDESASTYSRFVDELEGWESPLDDFESKISRCLCNDLAVTFGPSSDDIGGNISLFTCCDK